MSVVRRLLLLSAVGLACVLAYAWYGARNSSIALERLAATHPARMPADTVLEVVADDSVWLAPGERREWLLAPGRYRIAVKTTTPAGAIPLIEMAADLKCAPDRVTADLIHCLVRESTPLVIRHTAVRPSTGRELAVVSIHRVP